MSASPTPLIYGTSFESFQLVYLHEVKNAMNGNHVSIVLIAVGSGLLSFPVPLPTITLWPVGSLLILIGFWYYRKVVDGAYKSWEARKIPLSDMPSITSQSYNDSTERVRNQIYA